MNLLGLHTVCIFMLRSSKGYREERIGLEGKTVGGKKGHRHKD